MGRRDHETPEYHKRQATGVLLPKQCKKTELDKQDCTQYQQPGNGKPVKKGTASGVAV